MPFSSTGCMRQSTILPLSVVRRGTAAGVDGAVAAFKLDSNMQPVSRGKVKSGITVLHGILWKWGRIFSASLGIRASSFHCSFQLGKCCAWEGAILAYQGHQGYDVPSQHHELLQHVLTSKQTCRKVRNESNSRSK